MLSDWSWRIPKIVIFETYIYKERWTERADGSSNHTPVLTESVMWAFCRLRGLKLRLVPSVSWSLFISCHVTTFLAPSDLIVSLFCTANTENTIKYSTNRSRVTAQIYEGHNGTAGVMSQEPCGSCSMATMHFYFYFITSPEVPQHVWKEQWTQSSVLVLCRPTEERWSWNMRSLYHEY